MTATQATQEMEDRLLLEWETDGANWTRDQVIAAARFLQDKETLTELRLIRETLVNQR